MEMTLESALTIFATTSQNGIQLDFFRKNGQVLLQLFSGNDVRNWRISFCPAPADLVLMLYFQKNKTENNQNFNRFISSSHYNQFDKVSAQDVEEYYSSASRNSIPFLEYRVKSIIKDVYQLTDYDEITFTLNAY